MNMKPFIRPTPEEQPQPGEQPAPAGKPQRRTFIQPTFTGRVRRITTKAFAALALALAMSYVQAQTQPMNPDAPRAPQTPPQQPRTPQPGANDGWIMFDERNTVDLDLRDDQYQRLRDVDGRYQKEYGGFGTTPSKNPGYKDLSDRRNTDVRGILNPDQYQRWERMQNGTRDQMDRGTNGTNTDGGMKEGTPTTPRTNSTGTTPKTTPTPAPKTKP